MLSLEIPKERRRPSFLSPRSATAPQSSYNALDNAINEHRDQVKSLDFPQSKDASEKLTYSSFSRKIRQDMEDWKKAEDNARIQREGNPKKPNKGEEELKNDSETKTEGKKGGKGTFLKRVKSLRKKAKTLQITGAPKIEVESDDQTEDDEEEDETTEQVEKGPKMTQMPMEVRYEVDEREESWNKCVKTAERMAVAFAPLVHSARPSAPQNVMLSLDMLMLIMCRIWIGIFTSGFSRALPYCPTYMPLRKPFNCSRPKEKKHRRERKRLRPPALDYLYNLFGLFNIFVYDSDAKPDLPKKRDQYDHILDGLVEIRSAVMKYLAVHVRGPSTIKFGNKDDSLGEAQETLKTKVGEYDKLLFSTPTAKHISMKFYEWMKSGFRVI
jgi:hypothetical protein